MASKGKSKLKKHEIKFGSKCIDLKRFAYDVFVCSASKFQVPKSCICIWEGPENDYGCPDFCLVLSRVLLKHQIIYRCTFQMWFNYYCKLHQLKSFKDVSNLLQEVIKKLTPEDPRIHVIDKVEMSLSVSCELILFLYSKNSNLYLKEIAEYWLGCYFHLDKKKFEKAGGLDMLYGKCNKPRYDLLDLFYDTFIKAHCLPYEKCEQLGDLLANSFLGSVKVVKKKISKGFSPKECQELNKFLRRSTPIVRVRSPPECTEVEDSELSFSFMPDEDSELDLPPNTGLGIIPHEIWLQQPRDKEPRTTLPPDLAEESPPKPTKKQHRGSYAAMKKSKDRKRSVSVADEATSYQNIPGASSQETEKHRLSSQQKTESDFMEEGLRRLSLGSRGSKQSNEKKPNVSVADNQASSQNIPK